MARGWPVRRTRRSKPCDGVVITHGTDTMAYTAAALSFMLAGERKPVILTGSQLPMNHPLTDARLNLLRAFAAAQAGVPGVYVCFGDRLISGVRCVKTHTTSMDAFSSVNAPQAGHFDVEGVHFSHPPALHPAARRGGPAPSGRHRPARVSAQARARHLAGRAALCAGSGLSRAGDRGVRPGRPALHPPKPRARAGRTGEKRRARPGGEPVPLRKGGPWHLRGRPAAWSPRACAAART